MPKLESAATFFKPAADLLKLDVQWHDAIEARDPVKAHRILKQVLALGRPPYKLFVNLTADAYREYAKENVRGDKTKTNEWRSITNDLANAFEPENKKAKVATLPRAK